MSSSTSNNSSNNYGTLELHWSTSSDDNESESSSSSDLSLSPTQYQDYSKAKSEKDNHKQDNMSVKIEFANGPLIEIKAFTDKQLYQDEIDSMKLIHQKYMDKENKYLCIDKDSQFLKRFNINGQNYKIWSYNIMRIAWSLCQSRRIYQQSLQYLIRYLSLVKTKEFSTQNIDLLGCVCLRLSAKHNMSRYQDQEVTSFISYINH